MPFELSHPHFRFHSDREWVQVPTANSAALQLHCAETNTLVTMSMDEIGHSTGDLEPMARNVLASRRQAFMDAARKLVTTGEEAQITINSEEVEPHESALAYLMSFEGMQHGKSFVGYFGVLTRRKMLHVFVDTPVSFLPGRRGMFREVVWGFKPTLP